MQKITKKTTKTVLICMCEKVKSLQEFSLFCIFQVGWSTGLWLQRFEPQVWKRTERVGNRDERYPIHSFLSFKPLLLLFIILCVYILCSDERAANTLTFIFFFYFVLRRRTATMEKFKLICIDYVAIFDSEVFLVEEWRRLRALKV